MGSYYSIPCNEADSKDQYHLYFYTTEREIINWFELLHGSPPAVELESEVTLSFAFLHCRIFHIFFLSEKVKSTQTDSTELKPINVLDETKESVRTAQPEQTVEKKIMIDQAVQCVEVQQTLPPMKEKKKGLFASWFSKKKKK